MYVGMRSVIKAGQVASQQTALEDKTVCLFQKAVITMKNQVRPVCSPKDKICSRLDKLQRSRRLPLEQALGKQKRGCFDSEMI